MSHTCGGRVDHGLHRPIRTGDDKDITSESNDHTFGVVREGNAYVISRTDQVGCPCAVQVQSRLFLLFVLNIDVV